jgi:hypothetical protein
LRAGGDEAELASAVKQASNDQIAAVVSAHPDVLRQPAKPDSNWLLRCFCVADHCATVGQRLLMALAYQRKGCRSMGQVLRRDALLARQIVELGIDCRPVVAALGGRQSTIVPHLAGWKRLYRALAYGDAMGWQSAVA